MQLFSSATSRSRAHADLNPLIQFNGLVGCASCSQCRRGQETNQLWRSSSRARDVFRQPRGHRQLHYGARQLLLSSYQTTAGIDKTNVMKSPQYIEAALESFYLQLERVSHSAPLFTLEPGDTLQLYHPKR
ncbi:hypothetical protein ONS95_000322 [Cadophora gregata]|uniref:uncharacterized protein n=1 Tax=Cadophora gregata TaxID=51156 RepID=UPI0026DC5237|nr:uncharacterized protein ONS95_000322 [Cadophora gregata]KAK0128350.1 hypothetical protein ONS95_000322 [Cadophora gregata]